MVLALMRNFSHLNGSNLVKVFLVFMILMVSSCSITPVHQMMYRFDENEVKWSRQSGSSSIDGFAFLERSGSREVRSCAGRTVKAIPFSSFSREAIYARFESIDHGYIPYNDWNNVRLIAQGDEYRRYLASHKQTICDINGYFRFIDLPAGTYYLVSDMNYNSFYGGWIMKRVTLNDQEKVTVNMSQLGAALEVND